MSRSRQRLHYWQKQAAVTLPKSQMHRPAPSTKCQKGAGRGAATLLHGDPWHTRHTRHLPGHTAHTSLARKSQWLVGASNGWCRGSVRHCRRPRLMHEHHTQRLMRQPDSEEGCGSLDRCCQHLLKRDRTPHTLYAGPRSAGPGPGCSSCMLRGHMAYHGLV